MAWGALRSDCAGAINQSSLIIIKTTHEKSNIFACWPCLRVVVTHPMLCTSTVIHIPQSNP
eukprot:scaffold4510_cov183-Amphora_coffeaeformis.AAC.112